MRALFIKPGGLMMRVMYTEYINNIFTAETYLPFKEYILTDHIHKVIKLFIDGSKESIEVVIISRAFSLALEDFMETTGILTDRGRFSYTHENLLLLFAIFLDKLDTLTRMGIIAVDIATTQFVLAVEVFMDMRLKNIEPQGSFI